jgi:hypothetical protein
VGDGGKEPGAGQSTSISALRGILCQNAAGRGVEDSSFTGFREPCHPSTFYIMKTNNSKQIQPIYEYNNNNKNKLRQICLNIEQPQESALIDFEKAVAWELQHKLAHTICVTSTIYTQD